MSRIHEALKKAELEQETPGRAFTTPDRSSGPVPASSLLEAIPSPDTEISTDDLHDLISARQWTPNERTMLFFQDQERPGMEAFRTLRSRLLQIREKTPSKKILIAGSSGNEGKSFVAANLAQVMAQQQGSKALLIDGNLRDGQLHVELGAPVAPGLSNYLTGDAEAYDVIQRGPLENFYFVAAGSSTTNPLELVGNGRMSVFMNKVDSAFDWIIVDSCPAGLLTDAGMMANYCDAVLLVVRYNTTPYDLAQKTRREFYGKKILGVVLNGIDNGPK